jgi:hypothetical protein
MNNSKVNISIHRVPRNNLKLSLASKITESPAEETSADATSPGGNLQVQPLANSLNCPTSRARAPEVRRKLGSRARLPQNNFNFFRFYTKKSGCS